MATITLNKKHPPVETYQVWEPADLSVNDVLDVRGGLGGRGARETIIRSEGGNSTVRFNVVRRVYANHKDNNPWLDDAEFWKSPMKKTEYKIATPLVNIAAGETLVWDGPVEDIEIVSKASGLRITVSV